MELRTAQHMLEALKSAGWSQHQVAEAIQYPQASISVAARGLQDVPYQVGKRLEALYRRGKPARPPARRRSVNPTQPSGDQP